MQKILIVGPAWVGDMVMAQSLYKTLIDINPECIIDVMAPSWALPLAKLMPEVRNVISLSCEHGELGIRKRYKLGKQLVKEKYDQAIVLPNSFKSALVPWFAKIPQRIGWLGEFRHVVLNDSRKLTPELYPSMLQRFVALAYPSGKEVVFAQCPKPSLKMDLRVVEKIMRQYKLSYQDKPLLALCPGAEYGPAKRWPAEYFAELARKKIQDGWQVWLFGSKNDEPVAIEVQKQADNQCVNLVGKTQLVEAVNLLSLAQVVVANDSGLMHIAASLNRPVIAIYGPTPVRYAPPLTAKAKLLSTNLSCQPCSQRVCPLQHWQCMRDIKPKQVNAAIEELITI